VSDTVARPRRSERQRVILISRRRQPEPHASLRPDSRSHKHVRLEIGNQPFLKTQPRLYEAEGIEPPTPPCKGAGQRPPGRLALVRLIRAVFVLAAMHGPDALSHPSWLPLPVGGGRSKQMPAGRESGGGGRGRDRVGLWDQTGVAGRGESGVPVTTWSRDEGARRAGWVTLSRRSCVTSGRDAVQPACSVDQFRRSPTRGEQR
jgi:hypothetical protein